MKATWGGIVGLALFAAPAAWAQHDHAHHDHGKETAYGKPGEAAKASRQVSIDMSDAMRFSPPEITVKRGETIRFVVQNSGQLAHEMVLGTRADLEAHAEMMRKDAHMHHDDANMVHVAPGKTAEFGWHFTRAGEFYYGCLVPGHFEAGMVGKVIVAK